MNFSGHQYPSCTFIIDPAALTGTCTSAITSSCPMALGIARLDQASPTPSPCHQRHTGLMDVIRRKWNDIAFVGILHVWKACPCFFDTLKIFEEWTAIQSFLPGG